MKIWYGYGSEHSANLVMIGRFKDAGDAAEAKEVIDWLTQQVNADIEAGLMRVGELPDRFTDGMRELLVRANLNVIGPAELEQFAYDATVQLGGNEIVVTTDEIDVSAFVKVLLDRGARIELYSAHHYPDTGEARAAARI